MTIFAKAFNPRCGILSEPIQSAPNKRQSKASFMTQAILTFGRGLKG